MISKPCMKMDHYLKRFTGTNRITLVGPLYQGEGEFTDPVVFVDGGAQYRKNRQGFSIGDQDSHEERHDFVLPKAKNASDLAHALELIPATYSRLDLLGFLGGRRDHELINFGVIHNFLEHKVEPTEVRFAEEVFAFSAGEWTVSHNGVFSIFAFRPIRVSLTGDIAYSYTEKDYFPAHSSRGLSNKAWGQILIACSGPLFLFNQA